MNIKKLSTTSSANVIKTQWILYIKHDRNLSAPRLSVSTTRLSRNNLRSATKSCNQIWNNNKCPRRLVVVDIAEKYFKFLWINNKIVKRRQNRSKMPNKMSTGELAVDNSRWKVVVVIMRRQLGNRNIRWARSSNCSQIVILFIIIKINLKDHLQNEMVIKIIKGLGRSLRIWIWWMWIGSMKGIVQWCRPEDHLITNQDHANMPKLLVRITRESSRNLIYMATVNSSWIIGVMAEIIAKSRGRSRRLSGRWCILMKGRS